MLGVNRLLNCAADIGVGVSVWTIGFGLSVRGGQAQHETSPQGESVSELVHSSDLPGLIGKVRRTNEPKERVNP